MRATLSCDETEKAHLLPPEVESSDVGKHELYHVEPTWRHWLICFVVCVYMYGSIASFFALVEYTKEYIKEEEYQKANLSLTNTSSPCDSGVPKVVSDTESRVTSRSSQWTMYYSLVSGIPAIFSSFILGAYSDAFGRKFLLTICLIGGFLRLLISAVVIYFDASLIYLLIAKLVEGLTGEQGTCIIVSYAYAADLTKPGKARTTSIILIEFVIGISMFVGSFCSGYMVDGLGYETTILINAGLVALAMVISITLLPETLRKEMRHKNKSNVQILKTVFRFFTHNDENNSRWKYQIVLVCLALTNVSFLGRGSVETLYQLSAPFCWSPTQVGLYVAIRALCMMFIGLGALKVLGRWFDDVSLCMLGNLSYAAAFYWTAFVADDISFYLVILVGIFSLASSTMQRSILSHLTPPDKQGAIFTAVGVVETVTSLISNVTNSAIYAETVSYMRGVVFLVMES